MMKKWYLHSVEKGLHRLMSAPRDLDESWPRSDPPATLGQANVRHRDLFQRYLADLRRAADSAIEWWNARVTAIEERDGVDRDVALDTAYHQTPSGPASAPEVVHAVRQYWLECERINESLAEARIPPEVVLLEWLREGGHERELVVVSGMTYWPLGIDHEGRWV